MQSLFHSKIFCLLKSKYYIFYYYANVQQRSAQVNYIDRYLLQGFQHPGYCILSRTGLLSVASRYGTVLTKPATSLFPGVINDTIFRLLTRILILIPDWTRYWSQLVITSGFFSNAVIWSWSTPNCFSQTVIILRHVFSRERWEQEPYMIFVYWATGR